MRYFNTAGPIRPKDHYCFNPLERINLEEILSLIEQKKYFVLHAPRQTGKTSCLLALMEYLNNQTDFKCLYINVEAAQGAREDVKRGVKAILNELGSRSKFHLKDSYIDKIWSETLEKSGEDGALNALLSRWTEESQKPIVLFIDEIDSLIGDTLISVLRQIRAGYDKRPENFPQSIILCGVRDVRDYRIHSDRDKSIITGGSAFNIKAVSLRLGDFTEPEVYELLEEHTKETGQPFDVKAKELIWNYTQGQPWLVNALAYQACFETKAKRDKILEKMPITEEMIIDAKEALILRRETHLDQLADKLREERVRKIIAPMIEGIFIENINPDDLQYVIDLGLVKKDHSEIKISNPIYREVIPRELTTITQYNLGSAVQAAWYIAKDGSLDVVKLLQGFQEFFRENSEIWVERFDYKEAGPQLLMQAFLQRVINSGGRIEREYGLGKGRTDLMVIWNYYISPTPSLLPKGEGKNEEITPKLTHQRVQKEIIELKILHKSLEKTISDGLEQTYKYMDRCGQSEGHLVIFDREKSKTWEEKIFCKTESYKGKAITVWGM
ncbi:MAG: AAA-like domain-containing protein [Desulfamplus sp.]|nr:AAA-like domain-containing protein [Desulfamplus sp.]